MDDNEIRSVVKRLSRPHPSGGEVIERAAILAAGGDVQGIVAWIMAHDGRAEAAVPTARRRGLHGSRLESGSGSDVPTPVRFLLPSGALA